MSQGLVKELNLNKMPRNSKRLINCLNLSIKERQVQSVVQLHIRASIRKT